MAPHARETRPFAAEVKFVIPADLRQQVRSWARENLEPDPYGGGMFNDTYHTTSLYFDTAAGDVFHRRRSFGRSKYRVRRYGSANFVFLERKLRGPGFSSNGERPSRWIRSRALAAGRRSALARRVVSSAAAPPANQTGVRNIVHTWGTIRPNRRWTSPVDARRRRPGTTGARAAIFQIG